MRYPKPSYDHPSYCALWPWEFLLCVSGRTWAGGLWAMLVKLTAELNLELEISSEVRLSSGRGSKSVASGVATPTEEKAAYWLKLPTWSISPTALQGWGLQPEVITKRSFKGLSAAATKLRDQTLHISHINNKPSPTATTWRKHDKLDTVCLTFLDKNCSVDFAVILNAL